MWVIEPDGPWGEECNDEPWPGPPGPFSFGGSGLFRGSTNAGVELLGVLWCEELGELVLPEGVRLVPCAGDAAPEPEVLSFLEPLLESLFLESCSC